MKKFYCNKILVYTFVVMFFMIFDMIYFGLCYDNDNLLILSIINIIINIIFIPLISFLIYRKISRIITITNTHFEFINKDDSFKISLDSIDYFSYMHSVNGFYDLSINLLSGSSKSINLTKGVIKKIAKISKKRLKYYKNNDVKTVGESFTEWFKELKESIIENRYKILVSIIGLIVTVLFILIYSNFNNLILTIILCSFSFVFACVQLYFLYFKELEKNGRLIFSIIFILVIGLIFFGIACILFHNVFNVIDILIYTIFVLPSFVIVIMLILFLLAALSYT